MERLHELNDHNSIKKRDAHLDPPSNPTPKKSKTDDNQMSTGNELLFAVQADGAEDKGSRHSMEDKFVVLPDATLNFPPGTLRFSFFTYPFVYLLFFYIVYVVFREIWCWVGCAFSKFIVKISYMLVLLDMLCCVLELIDAVF